MARRYEDRYGRGRYGQDRNRDRADDRGYMDRATDEVRSWFGDDDAERRRSMDEQRDRQYDRGYGSSGNQSNWNRSGRERSSWNRDDYSRSDWNRGNDWNRAGMDYEVSRRADWNRAEGDRGNWGRADYSSDWNRSDWNRDVGGAGADRQRSSWNSEDWRGGASDWGRRQDYGPRWSTRELDQDRSSSDRTRSSGAGWSVDDGRTQFGQDRWGRGPKGYQRADNRIMEDVCDRLTYSEVDAEGIEVRVENAEVTLSGSVRDRWDKRRAEDIAENVSGVKDVHNNIRVARGDRGIGQSETSVSDQPGTVLGVNPTATSTITNTPPKRDRS
jgi:osmotically-inducible protein OsmY